MSDPLPDDRRDNPIPGVLYLRGEGGTLYRVEVIVLAARPVDDGQTVWRIEATTNGHAKIIRTARSSG